jgi:hypothetical protein
MEVGLYGENQDELRSLCGLIQSNWCPCAGQVGGRHHTGTIHKSVLGTLPFAKKEGLGWHIPFTAPEKSPCQYLSLTSGLQNWEKNSGLQPLICDTLLQ